MRRSVSAAAGVSTRVATGASIAGGAAGGLGERPLTGGGGADQRHAVDAYFLIASIHDASGRIEDAMSTYLEIASRYPEDARAPEARYEMAESMLKSKRPDRDAEARRIMTDVAHRYHSTPWAPRALMARAELETRHDLYVRDEVLGRPAPAALITYREVIERFHSAPAAPVATWKLAEGYASLKRFELAAATFETLADDAERGDEASFAAGDLYEKRLKDAIRAGIAYGRVRSTSSRYAEAQKRLQKLPRN